MENTSQKGFISLLFAVVVVILIGVVFLIGSAYRKQREQINPSDQNFPLPSVTPKASPSQKVKSGNLSPTPIQYKAYPTPTGSNVGASNPTPTPATYVSNPTQTPNTHGPKNPKDDLFWGG